MDDFEAGLEVLCQRYAVTFQVRPNGHYQIYGPGVVVNYYPFSKKRSMYVNGAVKGRDDVSAEIAVKTAAGKFRGRISDQREAKRPGQFKVARIKKKLMKRDPRCRYCRRDLTELPKADVVLEHIVPLSRGGSNRDDNLALACRACDQAKGRDLPTRGRGIARW